jgi:hypothetical protein
MKLKQKNQIIDEIYAIEISCDHAVLNKGVRSVRRKGSLQLSVKLTEHPETSDLSLLEKMTIAATWLSREIRELKNMQKLKENFKEKQEEEEEGFHYGGTWDYPGSPYLEEDDDIY